MWLLIKYQKFSHAFFEILQKKATTGGPLLKWFSVLPIPLPWFLAYIRASGGIFWRILREYSGNTQGIIGGILRD